VAYLKATTKTEDKLKQSILTLRDNLTIEQLNK
jgi:hypothetical protein